MRHTNELVVEVSAMRRMRHIRGFGGRQHLDGENSDEAIHGLNPVSSNGVSVVQPGGGI